MASNNSPPETPPAPSRRRSSIAELLQPRSSNSTSNNSGTSAYPSSMSSAMQSRQTPRRMSISTSIGLSGSQNTQTSPFGSFPRRRDSVSSSQESGSPSNEEAIMEENEAPNPANTPVSPFARRVSFGAQAFGSVRSGSFSNGTRRPSFSPLTEKSTNPAAVARAPSTKTQGRSRGEGFNWGDNLREKSGRPLQPHPSNNASTSPVSPPVQHQRSVSAATEAPPKQMPVQYQKPDVLGERMLRGDFTMD